MIPFNIPPYVPACGTYLQQAVASHKICGDGPFTRLCSQWLESVTGTARALLTTSATHALEMAAILANIQPGDEVIMPSYTFVSTANAFVLRGARIIFVDIRPDTLNLDEQLIEAAITSRTRAIVPVHYAGVSCEMDTIMAIAQAHKLLVIEDAAQAILATYRDRQLGTIGDFGCYSFHETKNLSMGEGGALLLRNQHDVERAEIIREKGTNRSQFWRGQTDKYTWMDIGSSYLPSELNAAYLYGQLESAQAIISDRRLSWDRYAAALQPLAEAGYLELPVIPDHCRHNGHLFYIKVRDLETRSRLIAWLKDRGVLAVFHYVPLHSAPAGRIYGQFAGTDRFTTRESDRLLRLPLYFGLTDETISYTVDCIHDFFQIN